MGLSQNPLDLHSLSPSLHSSPQCKRVAIVVRYLSKALMIRQLDEKLITPMTLAIASTVTAT